MTQLAFFRALFGKYPGREVEANAIYLDFGEGGTSGLTGRFKAHKAEDRKIQAVAFYQELPLWAFRWAGGLLAVLSSNSTTCLVLLLTGRPTRSNAMCLPVVPTTWMPGLTWTEKNSKGRASSV